MSMANRMKMMREKRDPKPDEKEDGEKKDKPAKKSARNLKRR